MGQVRCKTAVSGPPANNADVSNHCLHGSPRPPNAARGRLATSSRNPLPRPCNGGGAGNHDRPRHRSIRGVVWRPPSAAAAPRRVTPMPWCLHEVVAPVRQHQLLPGRRHRRRARRGNRGKRPLAQNTLGFIPLTVQQLHQPAPFSLRRARTSPCFFFQGTINSSEKWLSCSGTFGGGTGVGLGDKAKEAGVSNLLLSPVQLERSVGVSGLAIFLRVIIQLLVAQLFIRLMACSFPVLFPVSSARPARNPTPISKSTGTLQWLLGQPSTLSPCLRRQSFSGILFSSKMS
jgi:hypothetical protein